METTLMVIFALVGISIGSFLNVVADRLPAKKSLVYPQSHCDACQHRLSLIDLVPVFSYLWLRGRCRYCRAHVPFRVFAVELVTGLLFAFLFWRYGLSVELVATAFYCCVFIVIFVTDLEHQIIPNRIVYPCLLIAFVISLFLLEPKFADGVAGRAINAGIGGTIGFIILLVIAIISRGGMGFGDVKMAALIGLAVGFPMVFLSLLMGVILGGVVAVILLTLRIKKRKEGIPFGPFLSLATIVTILWGAQILHWYSGIFSLN